ncbi:MAG TPA: L-threonine 3-dehydrogenase [Candidatus Thermoplasmatota archaeon]
MPRPRSVARVRACAALPLISHAPLPRGGSGGVELAGTMRAVVKVRGEAGGTEIRTVPVPEIREDEVLIRVDKAGICGTDLHIYLWDRWSESRLHLPLIYGHEFAGTVEAVGRAVERIEKEDRVSGEGHLACWRCKPCREGNPHVCRNLKVLGVDRDGIFAEYVKLPATNVVHNDPKIPLRVAAVQDPLGNAVQTAFSGHPSGAVVLVLGCGPIGLMSVAVARAAGAREVIAIEKNEYRLGLARQMGATHTFEDPAYAERTIQELTDGVGVDDVYEMSGAAKLLNFGLKSVKPAGGVHILAIYHDVVPIDVTNSVVFKGVHVHGIHGRRMFDTWTRMQGMLLSGKLNIDPVFTHDFAFEQFDEGMAAMKGGNCGKVTLHW